MKVANKKVGNKYWKNIGAFFFIGICFFTVPLGASWAAEPTLTDSCPGLLDINKVIAEVAAAEEDPNQSVVSSFTGLKVIRQSENLRPALLQSEIMGEQSLGGSVTYFFDRHRRMQFSDCKELIYSHLDRSRALVYKIDLSRSDSTTLVLQNAWSDQEPERSYRLKENGVLELTQIRKRSLELGLPGCDGLPSSLLYSATSELHWGRKVSLEFAEKGKVQIFGWFFGSFVLKDPLKNDSAGCMVENHSPKIPTGGNCYGCGVAYQPDQDAPKFQKVNARPGM